MREDAEFLNVQPLRRAKGLFRFPSARTPETEIGSKDNRSRASAVPSAFITQLLDVHDYERKRIGQELHDSAGQLLVSLQLSVARLKTMQDECADGSVIAEIQGTVRELDQEIRGLAFLHHPAELSDRSLGQAIESLVRGFGRRTGIRASFKCVGDSGSVAEPISVTLLRVAQEALVNVHRHSHASSARVTLQMGDSGVHLTICDDGIGMPAAGDARMDRGIGLQGMRYRVEMQGGRFDIKGLKRGTRVSASLPLVA